jgi:hypothetical protein
MKKNYEFFQDYRSELGAKVFGHLLLVFCYFLVVVE